MWETLFFMLIGIRSTPIERWLEFFNGTLPTSLTKGGDYKGLYPSFQGSFYMGNCFFSYMLAFDVAGIVIDDSSMGYYGPYVY